MTPAGFSVLTNVFVRSSLWYCKWFHRAHYILCIVCVDGLGNMRTVEWGAVGYTLGEKIAIPTARTSSK